MKIPKHFLRKIVKELEKNGLVRLKRGLGGGIKLLKLPEHITLYDIIMIIEKKIALNRCVVNKKICGLINHCPVHPVWYKIREKFVDSLKEINFQELTQEGAAL